MVFKLLLELPLSIFNDVNSLPQLVELSFRRQLLQLCDFSLNLIHVCKLILEHFDFHPDTLHVISCLLLLCRHTSDLFFSNCLSCLALELGNVLLQSGDRRNFFSRLRVQAIQVVDTSLKICDQAHVYFALVRFDHSCFRLTALAFVLL